MPASPDPSPGPIAIINYDFRAGGTVARSIEIARAACEAGLPAQLWVVRAEGALRGRVPPEVPVFAMASGKAAAGRVADILLNLPRLILAIRRRRPAIMVSGGNHMHRLARLALRLSGRRGHTRLILRASNSSQRQGRPAEVADQRTRRKFAGADRIVAVAEELAGELRHAGVRAPVETIPNGVDLDRIARMGAAPFAHPFLSDKNVPVLVGMGRLERQKGFDVVIRAFARLRAQRAARLLLIGAGSAEKRQALEAIADEMGVADAVAFVGYQDNPFAILARADLFVSGSRWEGCCSALIEALACGLPIAATACPTGNSEVVMRGPYGTLAQVDDVEGLAAAMARELSAPRDRDAQTAGAAHWSLDRCLADWTRLLKQEQERARAGGA